MPSLHTPVGPPDGPRSRGGDDPLVAVVEYGDFECEYCARARPMMIHLLRRFGDRVRFVFRHFPVRSSHPHAQLAAEAAEVAASQGRFWPMHDLLFANPEALTPADLRCYAQAIGLDLALFDAALADRRYEQPVRAMLKDGLRSGVNATPTYFVAGQRYDGPITEASLSAAIQAALARAGLRG
ncbi:MAG: DsbA family protein [Ardenticatenaceae bacterium]|nr:DsbA family protein [Ardenticatenaceae bacterium]HBY93400.1 disulfide bond formation protein DsbA [Chloroflexota bacterium]